MNDRNLLQRVVAELKNGLLELESHSSMLKKRIFDLEKHLAEKGRREGPSAEGRPEPATGLSFSYDPLLLFGYCGPVRQGSAG